MQIYVLNHKTRSPEAVVAAIRREGREPTVCTDNSDYYKTRDKTRWLGLYLNFRRICKLIVRQESNWGVMLHDDVSVPPLLFDRIEHVLGFAPASMVSFYNPTNGTYLEAAKHRRHVVCTYANYWTQCFCLHKSVIPPMLDWFDKHILPEHPLAEDQSIQAYCSRTSERVFVVVPSLVQHTGFAESTFKIPAAVGRYDRNSATCDESFDVTTVDWAAAFARPYFDNTRKLFTDRLRNL